MPAGRAMAIALLLWLAPALSTGPWRWPAAWNPRAPLDIDAKPNFLTRYKLARLEREPALCFEALDAAGVDYRRLPDSAEAPGCRLHDAVRILRDRFAVSSPFALSCRAAVSLALWERHAVEPAAARQLQRRVVRLDHFGSYACRDIAGRDGAGRSRHATGDAVDIAGFILDGGQRVRVAADWGRDPAAGSAGAEARFLREIHDGACRYFDVVLGPEYNTAHRDHFHLDLGGGRACR